MSHGGEKKSCCPTVVQPGCSCRMSTRGMDKGLHSHWSLQCSKTCLGLCVWMCGNTEHVSIPSPPQSVQQITSLTADTQQLTGWGKRDDLGGL